MSTTIWIGREPFGAAAWMKAAEAAGWNAKAIALIRREALPLDPVGVSVLQQLQANDWLLLSSSGAVRYGLENLLQEWPVLAEMQLAVVGPGTAGALKRLKDRLPKLPQAMIADGRGGQALAQQYLQQHGAGHADSRPLLWLRAEDPRPEMKQELEKAGWTIHGIPVYRTEGISEGSEIPAPQEPVVLFSPSGGRALRSRVSDASKQHVIALGNSTAGAAEELGFCVDGVLPFPKPECLAEYLAGTAN